MDKIKNRREFLIAAGSLIGAGALTASLSSFLTSCEKDQVLPPPQPTGQVILDITAYPELMNNGGIIKTTLKDKTGKPLNNGNPVIIKRHDDNTFTALDSICPHALCEVDLPTSPTADIDCPCHHVEFSTQDGSITKKPIPASVSPLTRFAAQFDSGRNLLIIII